jgi:hypothetical protein
MTAANQIVRSAKKVLAMEGRSLIAFSNRVSFVNDFSCRRPVTVLSAVGVIRRNIWSEAQVLQCPQRAGIQ